MTEEETKDLFVKMIQGLTLEINHDEDRGLVNIILNYQHEDGSWHEITEENFWLPRYRIEKE